MAKNAMQNAWEYKRKEDERLQKLKTKKKQETDAQTAKADGQTSEDTTAKA